MDFRSDNVAGASPAILDGARRRQRGHRFRLWRRRDHGAAQGALCRALRARGGGLSGRDRDRRQRARAGRADAAVGRHLLPRGGACRGRRMRRARILLRRQGRDRAGRSGQDHGRGDRGADGHARLRPSRAARRHSASARRPRRARSTGPTRSRRSASFARRRGSRSTSMARALPMRWRRSTARPRT